MSEKNAGQDNIALLERLAAGDESVLNTIIENNMGLVRTVAKRFCDRGCEFEDLMQIGSIGLMRAARSFDFSFGCLFSTYAVPLIVGEIRRFLRDDGAIKVSRGLKSTGSAIMRKKEEFAKEHGRDPTLCELASFCEMSTQEVAIALEAISPIRSLSEKVGSEDGATLECLIGDKSDTIDSLTDSIALRQAIATLTPRQREIIEMRYFKNMSQQQTGDKLGLTQVKVSREEKKIIEALRHELSV